MKNKRFSEEQIIRILEEVPNEGLSIKDSCRKYGISDKTFYRWRIKYTGMNVPEVKKLKELEKQNIALKRLLAERVMEVDSLKDLLSKK